MTQDVADVISLFFDKLEEDPDFFSYYGVSEADAMALAKERAHSYLKEAIIYFKRNVELNFALGLETVEMVEYFQAPITEDEADILADIMVWKYIERGIAKLKPKTNMFSAAELKLLHSPAAERASFLQMVASLRLNLEIALSKYAGKDRLTGKSKVVDLTLPSDEEV